MLRYGLFALLIAVTAVTTPTQAQSQKGPNGGIVVVSNRHPVEFVLKGQDMIFYIRDDDGTTPLSTKTMKARATVQDGGKTATITLQPADPNMMTGKFGPLGSKARVVFSATFQEDGHSHTLTARYVTE